jgi:predicted ATP-dependent endonuclease of OLD family
VILKLRNIGKIASADIAIDAITVIAGENNTGKSTAGKALFCILNTFFKIEDRIVEKRKELVREEIRTEFTGIRWNSAEIHNSVEELSELITAKIDRYISDVALLAQDIKTHFDRGKLNTENMDPAKVAKEVQLILATPDEAILKALLQIKLQAEFKGQVLCLQTPRNAGSIQLQTNGSEVNIQIKPIKENERIDITGDIFPDAEAIYIDDPFVLDSVNAVDLRNTNIDRTRREYLRVCLTHTNELSPVREALDEIILAKRLASVFEKLNAVCSGTMQDTGNFLPDYTYKDEDTGKSIDFANVSTGLKTFVIIKTLLQNGYLRKKGILILDEPEIHLHPEWQLALAELIVLLQKEFDMRILLNTHSPYFLNAIEVYARKHGIAEGCRYYLAELTEEKTAVFSDVSDDIERIYKKLASPFQVLENEQYADD